MFPRLFTIPAFELLGRNVGPLTLHTYGVLLVLAFIAGLWVAGRQARRAGLDPDRIGDLAVYVLIAGLIGAKLALLVVEREYYSKNPGELLSIFQIGGVFYGGLIAAFPVAWWYLRRYDIGGWKVADVLAPGVAIGQAIGRLGCFAAGCCHGRPTEVAWAVTFRDVYASRTVGTPLDIPLHPAQLYESIVAFGIFLLLLWISGRKRFNGQVLLSYVVLYSIARFFLETFRGDVARGTVLGGILSTSQFIAIALVLGVLAILPYVARSQRIQKPTDGAGAGGEETA
jgi:phosphatidylglycerol---prolipoprotein diacylglyceryl transferase